jgi:MFS family permease
LAWNPLADHLGRRPALLLSLAIAILATYGAAEAKIFVLMMIARICQGFGISAPCSLGAAYIKEMYGPRDRGKALGFFTLGITAGPFIAPLVSGYVLDRR